MSASTNPHRPDPAESGVIFRSLRQAPETEIDRLMSIYRLYLRSVATQLIPAPLRGRMDESDLVQETLLRGASQLEQFAGSTDAEFAAWLRQILQNVVVDSLRHHTADKRDVHRETTFLEAEPTQDGGRSRELMRREELQRVEAALMLLTAEQRQVVELRSKGLSFVEIGQVVGRTPDATRMLWGRTIERLSQVLDNHD